MPLETLKIGLCGGGPKTTKAILPLVPSLRVLELSGMSLNRSSAATLAEALQSASSLEQLSLSLGVSHIGKVLNAIKNSPIRTLILRHTKLGDTATKAVAALMETSNSLKNLVMNDANLSRSRLETILRALSKSKDSDPIRLDVSNNNLGSSLPSAFKFLDEGETLPQIQGLFVGKNNVSGATLTAFCNVLPKLTSLRFLSLDGPLHWSSTLTRTSDGARLGNALA